MPSRPASSPSGVRLAARETRRALPAWIRREPTFTPRWIKGLTLRWYRRRFRLGTFIETGTYFGDTAAAMARRVECVHTIELSPELAERARDRFAHTPRVMVHCGDSGKLLPSILADIDEPCLLWLDGHWSEGVTARGDKDTPIVEELEAVLSRGQGDVVIIDDARCFTGSNDYPTIVWIAELAAAHGYHCSQHLDMIRLRPGGTRHARRSGR